MIRASLPWVMAKSTRKPAMAQDQLHMAKELLFPFIRKLITRRTALSIAPLPTGNLRRRKRA
jgi:hypothetical protein